MRAPVLSWCCSVLLGCSAAPPAPGAWVSIHVAPALPHTWVTVCGRRITAPDDAWPLAVSLTPGVPCTLSAERDDHGAVVRSPVVHLVPTEGLRRSVVLSLPERGSLGTPGFTLVHGPGGARVLPFDHTPVDPDAPHPAWLDSVAVVAVDGRDPSSLDAIALDRLAHGPPGTSLVLELAVPAEDASAPAHFPLMTARGARYLARFVRQVPAPWPGGHPAPAQLAAWAAQASRPPDEVAAAMARWRVAEPAVHAAPDQNQPFLRK